MVSIEHHLKTLPELEIPRTLHGGIMRRLRRERIRRGINFYSLFFLAGATGLSVSIWLFVNPLAFYSLGPGLPGWRLAALISTSLTALVMLAGVSFSACAFCGYRLAQLLIKDKRTRI